VAGAPVQARWRELSGTHHVDRVKVKEGRARSTRRAGRSRGAALEALRGEVEAAATRTLVAAGARLEERLRAVLAGPGAPEGGPAVAPDPAARSAARDDEVPAAVAAWSARADAAVEKLLAGTEGRERAEAAVKAFDRRGLATLLLASAALRDDLADRAATVVEAEVRSVLDRLEAPELAGDTATGLRVRLAELRRMT
jgi:hypothetical protein